MGKNKEPITLSLTPEAKELLAAIAKKFGISMSAILEQIIRKEAKENDLWK